MNTFPEKIQERMNHYTEAREHRETMVYTPEMDKELATMEVLAEVCYQKNVQILAFKPYSTHPDDHYLSCVLAYWPESKYHPYVVWYLNKHDKGLFQGDYFEHLPDAMSAYFERGNHNV